MLSNQQVFLFVDIILMAIALGIFIPITVFFIECSAALLPSLAKAEDTQSILPKVTVLVPAHNEASEISATLQTLLPQLKGKDQLVVIADNCSDETAEVARRFGATVIERQEPERRGKGYALDYGLRFIEAEPPDVVVLVDADCIVHQGTIAQIARVAVTLGRPVQATYLMAQPANPRPKDSISALAFMVKNLVRPKGLAWLGCPCLLTGTGMAFPWSVIHQAPLASGNIVEDMQLGLDLAIAGQPPVFCWNARVTGRLPQQQQVAMVQRTRWEHGHLQTLFTQVPQLLKAFILQRRFDLLALALELSVPPLSLLVVMWAAALGGALLAAAFGASWNSAIFLTMQGVLIFSSIAGAWAKFGRTDISILTLLAVPFYILWKIPLYLAFLMHPQIKWIRTERDIIEASD